MAEYPSGTWQTSWTSLGNVGGGVTIQPGLVCGLNANGTDELFGVGSDGQNYHIWNTGSGHNNWRTTWASLAGTTLDPHLVVSTTADSRLQIFGVSPPIIMFIPTGKPVPVGNWSGWALFKGNGYKFYTGQ